MLSESCVRGSLGKGLKIMLNTALHFSFLLGYDCARLLPFESESTQDYG